MFPGLLPQNTQILLNLDCFFSVSFSISLFFLSFFLLFSHTLEQFLCPTPNKMDERLIVYTRVYTIYNRNTSTPPHPITDDDADSHNLYVETEWDLIQWCVFFLLYHVPLYTTNQIKKKKKKIKNNPWSYTFYVKIIVPLFVIKMCIRGYRNGCPIVFWFKFQWLITPPTDSLRIS